MVKWLEWCLILESAGWCPIYEICCPKTYDACWHHIKMHEPLLRDVDSSFLLHRFIKVYRHIWFDEQYHALANSYVKHD